MSRGLLYVFGALHGLGSKSMAFYKLLQRSEGGFVELNFGCVFVGAISLRMQRLLRGKRFDAIQQRSLYVFRVLFGRGLVGRDDRGVSWGRRGL